LAFTSQNGFFEETKNTKNLRAFLDLPANLAQFVWKWAGLRRQIPNGSHDLFFLDMM